MTERAEMLARIARRLGQPAPRDRVAWDPRPSLPERSPSIPTAELVRRFVAQLGRLGGKAIRVAADAEAVDYVLSVVAPDVVAAGRGIPPSPPAGGDAQGAAAPGPVLLWDEPLLTRLEVAAGLAARGVEVSVWRPDLGPAALKELAARARAGVTGAWWGVAETGTVALPAGPGRGRLVSLLPRTHIAVLPESRLVPSVAELFRHLAAEPDLPSSLALATGPSRSADIENDLSIGVHGPADVHVVIVPG